MANFIRILFLVQKNFKIQICHPWKTAIAILIPIFFIFILILHRANAGSRIRDIETVFDSYDINTLPTTEYNTSQTISLYYTPKSAFLDGIMEKVSSYLNISSKGFESEDLLVASYKTSRSKVIAGVVFSSSLKNGPLSGRIAYTIRPEMILGKSWNLSRTMTSFPVFELSDQSIYGTYYMNYGFLTVQHVIAKTMIENMFSTLGKKFDDLFSIEMQRNPYPPYEVDYFYKTPDYYIAIVICAGLLFPCAIIAKHIVYEKQTHLKQLLILMGVSNSENWAAWFIQNFITLSIYCLIMSALLCINFGEYAVLNRSDPTLIFLWLILYASSIIAFTFFISTFFNKGNSAVAATCVLYILTFLPYNHSRTLFQEIPIYAKIILCLLPNTLFGYSVQIILNLELLGNLLDRG